MRLFALGRVLVWREGCLFVYFEVEFCFSGSYGGWGIPNRQRRSEKCSNFEMFWMSRTALT